MILESRPITKEEWNKLVASNMRSLSKGELKALNEFANMSANERKIWEKEIKKWMPPSFV